MVVLVALALVAVPSVSAPYLVQQVRVVVTVVDFVQVIYRPLFVHVIVVIEVD